MKILAASVTVLALCVVVALGVAGPSSASVAPLADPAWGMAEPVFEDDTVLVGKPEVAQDSLGNVHAIWYFYAGSPADPTDFGVMYAFRNLSGVWSTPVTLPLAWDEEIRDPTLLIAADDTVHVLWTAHNPDTGTAHMYLPPGGDWQGPDFLPYGREDVNARFAPDGTLHLIDNHSNTHMWLPAGGSWLTEPVAVNVRDFEIDSANTIHAIGSVTTTLAYGYKELAGPWVTEVTTYTEAVYPEIAVGPDNGLHAAWFDEVEYSCPPLSCYRYDLRYSRILTGTLASVLFVDSVGSVGGSPIQLEAAAEGTAHLLWQDVPLPEEALEEAVRYAERLGSGSWGLMDSRPGDLGRLAVAWNGDVHVVWRDSILNHQWREPGLPWSPIYNPDTGDFDVTWASGLDIAPGNQHAPNALHALHLLFASTNTAVYNAFVADGVGPVTAAFVASPTRGTAPLLVAFDNQSSGEFDTCLWTFGDGASSTDCNDLNHTYLSPGVYDVSLTVSGLGGTDTETKADYVAVFYGQFLPLVLRNGP